ncbi:LytR C-terminal domain-containing protein [Nocardia puris]|uniref:LytR cell envelope-related transcriptional attenuator n=1 Tax=Nocardia puris TaxID=208602 RepID=A0A366DCM6_9NOCA|nr:LytR C-terminal domain-containing protein [Nocardia puris]MBF6211203.1 LytR C-terminal domain-containing protein [Nocardia puris]MBF6364922.1 LytR C-terminal domain-containing protein [Nocardia puris]MBF6458708.1 LytR C-terminal domain-containing protein [Nocardia puris]RBO87793.1 LytR cell envelope-related transcriptional attenuator [Nocardia puris]
MSYPNPTSGGPPLRALAMVLIALAIVFAGLGAMSLSSSDSEAAPGEETTAAPQATSQTTAAPATTTAAPTTTDEPTTTTAAPTTTTTTTTTTEAAADRAVPVRVLNNSLVAGLAQRTANQLTASGWTNVTAGNYAGENLARTTVYYGNSPGEREAAVAIAEEIGAVAEPKTSGLASGAPGVVVILTGN